MSHYDVAVIGAGSAGLSAERCAREAGAKTVLIDEQFAGTMCASVGCMPSKLLIAAACAAHGARTADVFGIHAPPQIDGARVMARVREERDAFVQGAMKKIAAVPTKLQGHARFVDAHTLEVTGARITAKAIVVATGSRTAVPDVLSPVRSHVLTNETVFELERLPRSLAVLGAGALGLELAQAFARLGVEVTVLDEGHAAIGLADKAVEPVLRAHLEKELELHFGARVSSATLRGDEVELAWGDHVRTFERVLVAAGRPSRLDGLGLETTGLPLGDHGVPRFDPHTMRCGHSSIFIAGDVDHRHPVLHEAIDEGVIAGRNAASLPHVERHRRKVRLSITFVDPAVATVGEPYDPAQHVVGRASYEDQGRAKVAACNVGLVRLYADKKGVLRGATMFAPGVEHMAQLVACAIQNGMTAQAVLDLPIYHPTFEEGLKDALRQIVG